MTAALNCKPGQRAMIVRGCRTHVCVAKRVGCPVQVSHLVTPASFFGSLMEAIEGPVWELDSPVSCPSGGCPGLRLVPDACLRPFDDGSEPAGEQLAEDLQAVAQEPDLAGLDIDWASTDWAELQARQGRAA